MTGALHASGVLASTHSFKCRLQRLTDVLEEQIQQGKQEQSFTEVDRLLTTFARLKAGEQVDYDAPSPVERAETQSISSDNVMRLRKKRFVFQECHDVLLLKALLNDRGGVVASTNRRRPAWSEITASLNSQGVEADTHSLSSHLRLLLSTFHQEAEDVDMSSEKNQLLQAYCRKLDGEADTNTTPTPLPMGEARSDSIHSPSTVNMTELLESRQFVTTPTMCEAQNTSEAGEALRRRSIVEEAPQQRVVERVEEDRREQTQESADSSEAAQEEEIVAPAAKKQRTSVEDILERFVTEQNELRRDELEYKKTKFSAQQDLQRQTLALQRQALEVQDKALEMQSKLMMFMERVMDKIK